MRVGKVKLNSRVVLAPMVGVNCAAFRLLCKEYGAGLVSTPMLVVNQVVNCPEKTMKRVCFLQEEKPISAQLAGSDPLLVAEATRIIDSFADIININLGCPDKNILSLKAGAYLLKHPERIKKVISPVTSNTNKPVSVKIRIGWDEKSINTLRIVKVLEDLGVSAVIIHARTAEQGYAGRAKWDEIRRAKQKTSMLICGNGDVFTPADAKKMIEETGCDFVMIGRGAIGNPFIFEQTNTLLRTGKAPPHPSDKDRKECFMRFLKYYEEYECTPSFAQLRQHAVWFTKKMRGAKRLRQRLIRARCVKEIIELYNNVL